MDATAANEERLMLFAEIHPHARFQALREISVDVHDNFAMQTVRAAQFADHQEGRLAWDWRACRLIGALCDSPRGLP
jgi:hypothetical protein